MISGRVTPFSCFALSTTRACTHVSHYVPTNAKRRKIRQRNTFSSSSKEKWKLQVGKGRAQVVEILQSCCDWCCYLSSSQTSSCAQPSILNFGQIPAISYCCSIYSYDTIIPQDVILTELVLEFGRKVKVNLNLKKSYQGILNQIVCKL